jgi:phosphate transport system protein
VATDLRSVLSTMKIANNLERIADQAENIARRARKIIKNPEVPETRMIEPMYTMASDLLSDAMRAFSEGDADLALGLYDRDQKLDKLHAKTIKGLTKLMENDQDNLKTYLNLIFITRSLERVGDHAVNIGEDTVFIERATDIRHIGPAALEE